MSFKMVFQFPEDANDEKRFQWRPEIASIILSTGSLRENVFVGECFVTWATMTGSWVKWTNIILCKYFSRQDIMRGEIRGQVLPNSVPPVVSLHQNILLLIAFICLPWESFRGKIKIRMKLAFKAASCSV